MKRISRFALMTLFSLLLLGGTRAFAGSGGDDGNSQGQNNQGDNNQGNNNWIDNLLNDIFGSNNNSGDNSTCSGTPGTTNGGGTAPIDGGISLLLAAGVGLGIRKMAKRP